MTIDDLEHRVRQRFADVTLADIDDPAVLVAAIDNRLRRRRHARLVGTASIMAVSAVIAVVGVLALDDSDGPDQVVTAPGNDAVSTEGNVYLVTVGWQEGAQLADPTVGTRAPIEPTPDSPLSCNTCSIVTAGGRAFTAQGGSLYSFTPGDAAFHRIGSADLVFPTATHNRLFVQRGGTIEEVDLDAEHVAGPWRLPDGWFLTEQPHAVSAGLIVSNKTAFIGALAWRDLATGEVHPWATTSSSSTRTQRRAGLTCWPGPSVPAGTSRARSCLATCVNHGGESSSRQSRETASTSGAPFAGRLNTRHHCLAAPGHHEPRCRARHGRCRHR